MRLQSTSGQSTGSVIIAMIGKTTDFISTNGLVMPLQYVIMVYFSSSVAYVNGLQVAWYYGNEDFIKLVDIKRQDITHQEQTRRGEVNKSFQYSTESVHSGQNEWNVSPKAERKETRIVFIVRWLCLVILSLLLLGCVAGFVWNVDSYFGLFGPVSITCVIMTAKLYFQLCKTSKYTPGDKF